MQTSTTNTESFKKQTPRPYRKVAPAQIDDVLHPGRKFLVTEIDINPELKIVNNNKYLLLKVAGNEEQMLLLTRNTLF
jgi:hypothetical protein